MFTSLINLFYPKLCAGCASFLLAGETVICAHCRHEIPITNHLATAENEAMKKFYGKVPVEFAAAFMYFHKKGIVQEMIHQLKYKGNEAIGTAIGDWYVAELQYFELLRSVDVIIAVPLHPKKLRERGYNQVTAFGLALSSRLNLRYQEGLLIRKQYSKTQTRKTLLGRTEVNAQSIFEVEFDENDHGKHFLLIDDVLTTGSTLEACSRALLKIPRSKVSIICMAMSHS